MKTIYIEATSKTPRIELDPTQQVMRIIGRSMPDDEKKFYKPICTWFEDYVKLSEQGIQLEMYVEYFNSPSAKNLLSIFKSMKAAGNSILWHYAKGDEFMLEAGYDFQNIIGSAMQLVELESLPSAGVKPWRAK